MRWRGHCIRTREDEAEKPGAVETPEPVRNAKKAAWFECYGKTVLGKHHQVAHAQLEKVEQQVLDKIGKAHQGSCLRSCVFYLS